MLHHRVATVADHMRSLCCAATLVTALLTLVTACGGSSAQPHRSDPMTTDEVAHISRQDLRTAMAARSIIVVDTLPSDMHRQAHLPGAVNIPGYPYETAAASTDEYAPKLLPDKNAQIALYCINAPCRNSEFVGRRLMELGYTHVAKYAEGIQDWSQANLPLEAG